MRRERRGLGRGTGQEKDRRGGTPKGRGRESDPIDDRGDKDREEAPDDGSQVEGRNPVLEAIRAGRTLDKLFIAKGSREGSIREIIRKAEEQGVIIQEVPRRKLDEMSETRGAHQGVIALVTPYTYVAVEDILKVAKEREEPSFIIVLDEITDPHNLGSIIRTGECSGAHGIIIPKRRAVGLTPAAIKASAGAAEFVPVAKVTNIADTLDALKEEGLWVAGAHMEGENYTEVDLSGPIALVIGSEGKGLRRLVKEKCDFLVKIPLKGRVSSLNASVAAGVLMYETARQRETP